MDYNIGGTILRSEPATPELNLMLQEARTNLLLASTIYAYTMTKVDYLFTYDLPIPTAAAIVHDDIQLVAFNPDFFAKGLKNAEERAFVLMHELDHIFFMHQDRTIEMGYDHDTANRAADFYINLHASGLYKDKEGKVTQSERYAAYLHCPKIALFDKKYLGMSFDEIYEQLVEDDAQKPQNSTSTPQSDASEPQDGEGNPSGGNESTPGEEGEGNPSGGSGSKPGEGGSGHDTFDIGNGGSRARKMENVQILQAAATFAEHSKGIGESEGDLVQRIRDMAKPVIVWEDRLSALISSSIKQRPTYNRISHRTSPYGGPVFPSYTGFKVNVFYGVDSSGSMDQSDYMKATGELSGILEQFDAWEIHLASCDVKAHSLGVYSSEDGDTITDVVFDFKGLGGTLMSPLAKQVTANIEDGIEHNAFVLVTDGFIPEADLDGALPTECVNIVISTGNKNLKLKNAEVIYL